jgi:HEPN domain-containing protein
LAVAAGISVPNDVRDAAELSDYASAARYPGEHGEEVTEEEYRRAVELGERVVRWGEEVIGRSTTD